MGKERSKSRYLRMDHVTRSRPVHPSDAATNGLSVSALIHASLAVMASFQYLPEDAGR